MAEEKLTRGECLGLLCEMAAKLKADGQDRYPRRSDFTEMQVVYIKAYFGPWPRALEAAEIKPMRDDDRKRKNLEKRIRAKRRRNEARGNNRKASDEDEDAKPRN